MKHEYHEGPEAAKRLKELATHLFRAPKPAPKEKLKPERKHSTTSKG
jgi:hypothetical protein